jgi:hypothetical protein
LSPGALPPPEYLNVIAIGLVNVIGGPSFEVKEKEKSNQIKKKKEIKPKIRTNQ